MSERIDAAIIVAMKSEQIQLERLLPGWEPFANGIWPTVRRGNVIAVTCGVGLINAAAATEYVMATLQPEVVLNFGCAGAHLADVYPGDVVIGETVMHQGKMIFAPDGDIVPMSFNFTVPGDDAASLAAVSDAGLVTRACTLAESLALPAWPAALRVDSQPDRAPLVHVGTVSSGDIWIQSPAMIRAGHARTRSLCEDMEAVAIAQICAMHRAPFLTVKDISNSELHESTVFTDESDALPLAEVGLRAAMVIVAVLQDLGYS